jgi:hypothetical protein
MPASTVSVEPHSEHDPQEFVSITHLANRIDSHGYYGGVRLLLVRLTNTAAGCVRKTGGGIQEKAGLIHIAMQHRVEKRQYW